MLFLDMTKQAKPQQDYPKPETLEAVLMSEGLWRFSRHVYDSTTIETMSGEYGGTMYVYHFRCLESGVIRPWGTAYLDVKTPAGVN